MRYKMFTMRLTAEEDRALRKIARMRALPAGRIMRDLLTKEIKTIFGSEIAEAPNR